MTPPSVPAPASSSSQQQQQQQQQHVAAIDSIFDALVTSLSVGVAQSVHQDIKTNPRAPKELLQQRRYRGKDRQRTLFPTAVHERPDAVAYYATVVPNDRLDDKDSHDADDNHDDGDVDMSEGDDRDAKILSTLDIVVALMNSNNTGSTMAAASKGMIPTSLGSKQASTNSSGNAPNGVSNPTATVSTTTASTTIVTRHQQNNTDIWGNTPPKEPKSTTCDWCGKTSIGAARFAPHLDKCMGIGTTSRNSTISSSSSNPSSSAAGGGSSSSRSGGLK